MEKVGHPGVLIEWASSDDAGGCLEGVQWCRTGIVYQGRAVVGGQSTIIGRGILCCNLLPAAAASLATLHQLDLLVSVERTGSS